MKRPFLSSEFHVIEIKHLKPEASKMSSFLITSQKSLAGRASRQQLSGDGGLLSLQCVPGRAGYRPRGEESRAQGREASASLSFQKTNSHFSSSHLSVTVRENLRGTLSPGNKLDSGPQHGF